MKILCASLLLMAISVQAKSQTSADSVKAVVNQLFTAMKTSNAVLLLSAFGDSAILQTIATNKDGVTVKNESVKSFANSIKSAPSGALDERISFDVIKIDGALASVWTPYSFYYNNKFSHCGVNSFQIIRTSAGWKIQYLIDTRRKTGCQ